MYPKKNNPREPVRVYGPREFRFYPGCQPPADLIDTTSKSQTWSAKLSPFHVGPIPLYEGAACEQARNLENAWQYAKVYQEHVGPDQMPLPTYYNWAREGWSNPRAVRYPMGKGAVPAFSWWAGEKLAYVEARKKIYIPLYARAVSRTEAFERLLDIYRRKGRVILWDFDGYDHLALGMTIKDVVHDPNRKMGHAFVLAYLLERLT